MSSQIEGTQSSLSDLLLFENGELPTVSVDDVSEVSSYVAAMNYGLKSLEKFPLSLRLIREIHEKLMNNSRGGNKQPGEFRTSQNWIGGSRPGNAKFVPPSPEYLMSCLDNFEKFLHDENIKLPILVRAALAHVQFETIHPFLDGNGRLGRLLITFMLCANDVLKEPLLYLSLYFKTHRAEYYNHLQSVRLTGDWEPWIKFFLTGILETANQATSTARAVIDLFKKDKEAIEQAGKPSANIAAVYSYLQKNPITNSSSIKRDCKISLPTTLRALEVLQSLNIVKEITGKDRHMIFTYKEYLDLISSGTGHPFSN
jgi:Fic family protein